MLLGSGKQFFWLYNLIYLSSRNSTSKKHCDLFNSSDLFNIEIVALRLMSRALIFFYDAENL